jgi:uncharacterized protein YndB with AHSA1/START domain
MSRGPIVRTIEIDAAPRAVWDALTNAGSMTRWMAEPDVGVEVITDWRHQALTPGSRITYRPIARKYSEGSSPTGSHQLAAASESIRFF